tara:strand:- start:502 stop:975 length:474 start_codon:yes stop_codon:yes gene_type:complete
MIEQISNYFTTEIIYLWLNIGVLPFWLVLIFFPQSNVCKYLVTSIFPYLVMSIIYIYLIYDNYQNDYKFIANFTLYMGIDDLNNLFNDNSFLITFWIHFLAINLFCGSWIVKDSSRLTMPKFIIFFPLLITYFIGPVGLLIYWMFRIFFAKRLSLYD